MLRVLIASLVVLFFWLVVPFAQEQPTVNCATIEQCRILVMVTRGQLLSAQDAWAFWAEKASKVQEELDKVKKETTKKEQEHAKTE